MKMTKKLFLVAIATAAFALTSCDALLGMGGKTDEITTKQTGTKYKLSIDVAAKENPDGAKRYQRMWKQLGAKETVQSLQTVISIDTTKVDSKLASKSGSGADELWVVDEVNGTREVHAVAGLIFDLHQTKTKEVDDGTGKKVTKKSYDFVLIGYRPYDNGFYVERYTDITEDLFAAATNDSSFKDPADQYISNTSSTVYYEYAADHSEKDFATTGDAWVEKLTAKLGKDDDGKDYGDKEVPQKRFTVTITQPTPGVYNINLAGKDFTYTPSETKDDKPEWYNKDGYRIGGAGYYVNSPLGTAVKAMFDSKNDITKGLEEEVEE